jgi:hypothetical protein
VCSPGRRAPGSVRGGGLRTDRDPGEPVFAEVLDRYFGGEPDLATEAILDAADGP